jgi:ATP-dependent Clp protease ATP-binding subunit ClpA
MQASQDEAEREKLLNLESLIHQRLVGQDLAVTAVSDALRRSAAGVRNENRPIGTFLFLGPTGVGKTELAKAISEVYFKGEGEIVRIDLNEYVSADDVQRLIADGATDELSLTAQVMKHPFSVVLLDEIEKAHPLVLTTLLQLLDEGILRDVKNREVSFRDTIVVATSNAGANKIRDYIDQGMDMSLIKEQLTNDLISGGEFKPEFLNRFDEICVFQPLDKEALLTIVDLIIASVNKTLEPRKISVTLEPEAKALLVERGYDPKLGARPMRRIVSKTVENIVARSVLAGATDSGDTIAINEDMIKAAL